LLLRVRAVARGCAMRRCERVSPRNSGRSRGSRHHKPETATNARYVPDLCANLAFARILRRPICTTRNWSPQHSRRSTARAELIRAGDEGIRAYFRALTESSLCRTSPRGTSNWKNPFDSAWCPDGIRPKSVEHLCPVLTSRRPIACGGSRKSILCRPPSGNDLHLSARGVMHMCPLRGPGETSIYEVLPTVAARLEPCGPRAVFYSESQALFGA